MSVKVRSVSEDRGESAVGGEALAMSMLIAYYHSASLRASGELGTDNAWTGACSERHKGCSVTDRPLYVLEDFKMVSFLVRKHFQYSSIQKGIPSH